MKRIVLALTTLLLVLSCQKDRETPQVEGFKDLLDAYRQGWTLKKVEVGTNTADILFNQGTVKLNLLQIWVYDCTVKDPAVPYINGDGFWCIGSEVTGIKYDYTLPDADSQPVYICYTHTQLQVHLSNAKVIRFDFADARDVQAKSIPVVHITHWSDRIHRSSWIDADIVISDPDSCFSDVTELKSKIRLKGRGQSTWNFEKKPFKIKFPEQHKVLGMPKNKDWAFLANYPDKSLLRNATAMKTSEILGMDWTPRFRKVEVYINNEYQGVYDLFETKEVTKHKVNINLDAGDTYLEVEVLEYDFLTPRCGVPILVKEPEDATQAKKDELKKLFTDFETALFSTDWDETRKYLDYIDEESFINNFIIEELSKDIDGCVRKSSFLTCEKGVIRFYHEWDFDIAYGNAFYFPNGEKYASGWFIKDYDSNLGLGDSWYNRLFKDPAFVKNVQERWKAVYPELQTVPDYIDEMVIELGDAPDRNFQKWPILNEETWPCYMIPGTYAGEVAWLKQFYKDRLSWMNTNLKSL